MRRPSRPGFTLIELLTVIAIIGLLAAILIPAAMGVMKRSKQAGSQAVFSGWCSGIIRYKQAYGFFPNIASPTAYPTADIVYNLQASAAQSANFYMCLAGRQPSGVPLTGAATGQRATLNRNAEAFVEFSAQDFELPTAMATAGTSTAGATNIGTGNFFVDRFGNRKIYVAIDFGGDGVIKSATGAPVAAAVPTDIAGYRTTTGYQARVIIYTSKSDVISAPDMLTQSGSNAIGTPQSDFLDVIAAQ